MIGRPDPFTGADPAAAAGVDPVRRAELARRLAVIEERIAAAARAAGRDPAGLTLIAVSKTYPAEDVVMLRTLGARQFAENREQEAGPKVTMVTRQLEQSRGDPTVGGGGGPGGAGVASGGTPGGSDLTWHFVGQLQRNKARSVLRWADWVQSVDRSGLVGVLSRLAVERGRPLSICLQVSLDLRSDFGRRVGSVVADSGRGGADPAELPALADLVDGAPGLTLRGVMAVAPRGEPARPAFERLRAVAERLVVDHPQATVISAGMSGDLEAAVAEGATHLRIGTALFGERPGVP
ncbi:putative enzyme with a TIM-barrel fold [Frankia torreyi]|uniref:Pyridoxal phosphate homeostasis protein n=1 Tax=Frankia torreyi TaxID=1856 RepID=A0A0D8BLG3_9ACTN|nr:MULTISPECIES: alanine racemase [Frankia]KJE24829.1 putative enzyme with a TIM-barrel fold [Frankia torreyi]KQC39311.1 PLP-binding domain-containing protein [Frankia sp. ACN1ag]KQM07001.1 putative enzyme with a TIM-barrel fold [Frankia sp. CpI1-P]